MRDRFGGDDEVGEAHPLIGCWPFLVDLPLSRPATQLAEIMAKIAPELEARSDQGPTGDLNRSSIQEACRAQRDPTAWLGM